MTGCCGSTTCSVVEEQDQDLTVPYGCVCVCVCVCVRLSMAGDLAVFSLFLSLLNPSILKTSHSSSISSSGLKNPKGS